MLTRRHQNPETTDGHYHQRTRRRRAGAKLTGDYAVGEGERQDEDRTGRYI